MDNLTGEPLWRISLDPGVRGIAAGRSLVYVASMDHVKAYNRLDGSQAWTVRLPQAGSPQWSPNGLFDQDGLWKRSSLIGPISVSDNIILTGGWRGYSPIYLLHPETGECRWAASLAEPWVPIETKLIRVANREWICALANDQLLVLDPGSGEVIQKIPVPAAETLWFSDLRNGEGCASWNGLAKHWLLQGKNSIYKFIPGEPSKLEVLEVDEPIFAMQPLSCSGRAFYMNSANILKSINFSDRNVQIFGKLNHNLKYLLPVAWTKDGLLYVGSSFGFLYVFAADGKLIFRKKMSKGICTEMACLPDDSVIFGTASGEVVCCKLISNSTSAELD